MATVSREIAANPGQVLEAAKKFASSHGWEVVKEQPGRLEMRSPASLRSWGESIKVQVADDVHGYGSHLVTVTSGANYQLFDWGKSSENASVLLKDLKEKLG